MVYDGKRRGRRSIRLAGYDYSLAGGYFVTVVTKGREDLFGEILEAEMRLNRLGILVYNAWLDIPRHYPHVILDEFCIMPNHFHAILFLSDDGRGRSDLADQPVNLDNSPGINEKQNETQTCPYRRHGLPEIIRAFKSFSARRINQFRHSPSTPVWQRNYYEHIIRNENERLAIQCYIKDNPQNWERDEENNNSRDLS